MLKILISHFNRSYMRCQLYVSVITNLLKNRVYYKSELRNYKLWNNSAIPCSNNPPTTDPHRSTMCPSVCLAMKILIRSPLDWICCSKWTITTCKAKTTIIDDNIQSDFFHWKGKGPYDDSLSNISW